MTEAQLHKAVAQFLAVALKPPTIWTTIGHGGGGRVRGAILKGMGVQPGWPDIIVIAPKGKDNTRVFGIELKARGGSQSEEQFQVAGRFIQANAHYAVCRSVEQVEGHLRYWKFTLHASVLGK